MVPICEILGSKQAMINCQAANLSCLSILTVIVLLLLGIIQYERIILFDSHLFLSSN